MSLTPFTGTVTAAALIANFDDKSTTLTAQALLGRKDANMFHRRAALGAADNVSLRSVDFVAPDDLELRILRLTVLDGAAGRTVTGTLTQTDGDTSFLLDKTLSVSVTTVIGTAQASLDKRTTSGDRHRLLKGVRYRLTLSTSAGPVTAAQITAVLRTARRLA